MATAIITRLQCHMELDHRLGRQNESIMGRMTKLLDLVMISDDDKEELLLSCRYGDLSDVQKFLGDVDPAPAVFDAIQDDNGNTLLHMAAANGHADILAQLLPRVSSHLLAHRNSAGSTALHWASVNHHLDVAKLLVQYSPGPGIDLIDIKNDIGRSPLAEAEIASWDEGAQWFVQVMRLDQVSESVEDKDGGELEVDEGGEGPGADPSLSRVIEVEIQDAGGQLAKMSIRSNASISDQEPS